MGMDCDWSAWARKDLLDTLCHLSTLPAGPHSVSIRASRIRTDLGTEQVSLNSA